MIKSKQNVADSASDAKITDFASSKSDEVNSATSNNSALVFTIAVFFLPALVVVAATWNYASVGTIALGVAVGLLCALTVHVAFQWEKVVIVRLGKLNRIVGPGLYFTIPIIEAKTATIDQRIRITSFGAEETLSSDLVPVNVDAVLFWVVWDAEKACTEVRDYMEAVSTAAQTAMRDVIGQICLSEIAMRRTYLDEELKRHIEGKVEDWGLSVIAVEIRDIVIPKGLQDAMSRQAQAEREREARFILAEVERDISDIYVEAAEKYGQPEKALQLRTMNLLYDSVKDTGGTVVIPSAFSDGFNSAADDIAKSIFSDPK